MISLSKAFLDLPVVLSHSIPNCGRNDFKPFATWKVVSVWTTKRRVVLSRKRAKETFAFNAWYLPIWQCQLVACHKNKHFPKLFKINSKFFLMVSRLFAHCLLTSLQAISTVPLIQGSHWQRGSLGGFSDVHRCMHTGCRELQNNYVLAIVLSLFGP